MNTIPQPVVAPETRAFSGAAVAPAPALAAAGGASAIPTIPAEL
ncbi:hypothetical protein [Noviherbaspirillum galbum]|nr:hypothetical protein [Noviherbaspirillum galbum]